MRLHLPTTWRLFGPCRDDDDHRGCAERLTERAGTVVVRCSCDCHVIQEEQEEQAP